MTTERKPMSAVEIRGLAEIEKYWYLHGKFPKIFSTPGFDLQSALKSESFVMGLFNRGIKIPDHSQELSDAQMAAILVVVDINDRRSIPAKLKGIGINSQTWQGWMKDLNFKEYLHSLSTANFEDALHVAQQGLLSAVERGDVNAIKYYNQTTGREVAPEIQNARILISRLVQVIQSHVKDQETLTAISRDFERVMRGDAPASVGMIERML